MAKGKNTEVEETKQYKGTAKRHIKYDGKYIVIGEKFDIAEKDVEELRQYAYIEEVEVKAEGEQGEGQEGE